MTDRIQKTMDNLRKNNMEAHYAETAQDACNLVEGMLKIGEKTASGGSATLAETGILKLISSDKYNYVDRTQAITEEERRAAYLDCMSADTYFCSSNAITLNGQLYNVDGNSNRVSAILYGPLSVIMIVGKNKIVDNIAEAEKRVKTIAAPINAKRLSADTYCNETGHCISLDNGGDEIPCGCQCERRICANYVICARQRKKNRIKIIIVNENLGY
ncbi:MAG: lactate utilization protein [Oscillospiraceae bacterium]